MTTVVVAGLIVGVVLSFIVIVVLYRAIGNLIDWTILTFGNEQSVRRVKDKHARKDEGMD